MQLNLFCDKEVSKFKKEFHKKEYEMLVLTNDKGTYSGGVRGSYIQPSVRFVASINLKNREFSEKIGRLEWLDKSNNERKISYNIEKYKIYQVRVRKCKEIKLEKHQNEILNNRYMLIKIIKEVPSEEKLDKIKQELLKPITIKNNLGNFDLNRDFSWFEGQINWLSRECHVYLGTDIENGNTANNSIEILQKIVKNIEALDEEIREFASKKLTSLANDWNDDENNEITKEDFMNRLFLKEIDINNKNIIFYFDDDDMFCGHSIMVTASFDLKCIEATI